MFSLLCYKTEPTITRPFTCLTTIAKQRINMHIIFLFLNNHVGTPKGQLQEYLSPFRGNKAEKVRVRLERGRGIPEAVCGVVRVQNSLIYKVS